MGPGCFSLFGCLVVHCPTKLFPAFHNYTLKTVEVVQEFFDQQYEDIKTEKRNFSCGQTTAFWQLVEPLRSLRCEQREAEVPTRRRIDGRQNMCC